MQILITGATGGELKLLREYLRIPEPAGYGKITFNKYRDHKIDFLLSGPGINYTAFNLGTHLAEKQYDLCIQAGIAGAFDHSIQIGETLFVRQEQFSQSGAEDGKDFIDMFDLGLLKKAESPFTDGKLINHNQFKLESISHLRQVNAITVETVHGDDETILKTVNRYHPDIESMEGAPFFFACLMHKIPFIQIRSISNYVERRNKGNWKIALAVETLNATLIKLIDELAGNN